MDDKPTPPVKRTSGIVAPDDKGSRFNSVLASLFFFLLLAGWNSCTFLNDLCQQLRHQESQGFKKKKKKQVEEQHFCRIPQVPSLRHRNQTFTLEYQCAGTPYETFGQQLHEYAQRYSNVSSHWGRRDYPLPPNKKVLIFGNSHLRQVSKTLVCQYHAQIEHYELIDDDTFTITFRNNATWISVTNSPIVYSPKWKQLLESRNLHNTSLNDLDAILLGKFNTYLEAKNTGFEVTMRQQQAQYDSTMLDFEKFSPPGLADVAKVFPGPIIATSMFAQQDGPRIQRELPLIQHNPKFSVLDGRRHIDLLGIECGSDDKRTIGTCHEPGEILVNSNRNPADMHRCAGPLGGHPDLVAWDSIEEFYRVLNE